MPIGVARATMMGGIDPSALLWKAAVVTAGATVSGAQLSYVSTLIRALKSAGVWTLLDRLWLFASENATQALIDIKGLQTATAVNSPTFTASQGYTPNGTTSYIDTNLALSAATKFTQDDGHLMFWRRTAANNATQQRSGASDGTSTSYFNFLAAVYSARINGTNANATFTGSDGTGCHIIVRTGAAAVNTSWNGTPTGTSPSVSVARAAFSVWLGAENASGVYNQGSNGQEFAFSLGASLTAAQQLALYNAVNAYKTSVGA